MTPTNNPQTHGRKEDANLGIALLIAEQGPTNYLPIAPVSSIGEAREMAQDYLRRSTVAGVIRFKVWACGTEGYTTVAEFGS